MPVTDQAFVTLATSDVYFQGALVLGHSLRHHRTSRQLVILTTPQVSSFMRVVLRCVFDEVIEVKEIDSRDAAHLALMKRPELGITFTKLHCWALIKYTKCVFLDADTLVLCNVDELFDREEISAAPDPGWPDCFNTGVFVFRPSLQTYNRLFQFAVEHGSFDGGDQGLLNSFFNDWAVKDIDKHLPFIYNLSSSIAYTYLPAFRQFTQCRGMNINTWTTYCSPRQMEGPSYAHAYSDQTSIGVVTEEFLTIFGHEAKIVHFLGPVKPWHCKYNPQTRSVFQEFGSPSGHHHIHFLNLWWEVYNTQILPLMMQHNDTWGSRELQQHKHQVGHVEVTIKPASTDLDKSSTQQLESSKRKMPAMETFVHKKEPRSSDSSPPEPEIFLQPPSRPAEVFKEEMQLINIEESPRSDDRVPELSPQPSPDVELLINIEESPSFDDRVPESEIQMPSPQPSPGVEPLDLAASVSELSIGTEPEPCDPEGRQKWEEGHMDYMGKDSFENIKKKLDRFLE